MCQHCNYSELLSVKGLDPTPNRIGIMETIGNKALPIGAQEIFEALHRTVKIHRVTVYRILDLLVEKGVLERLGGWGRSLLYAMAPSKYHPAHPHFHCKTCGAMYCLQPLSLNFDIRNIQCSFAGEIKNVEIQVSGICRNCLQTKGAS
jgi:Fur family ferric uptake transcriptional regulator